MNIVIDMGGTNTRIGFAKNSEEFENVIRFPTPATQEETHERINDLITKADERIDAVVLGVAGVIDYTNNRIVTATNIPWVENMTPEEVTGIKNVRITPFNDAELAGLAESYMPYATNYRHVVYITLSTGVGGTLIKHKKPARVNFTYEPGHIIIDRSFTIDHPADGIQGSFENLCSGTGFQKRYGMAPENCTDQNIWNEYGGNVACGLHNIILLWQPDAIVLGGSMTNQWEKFHNALLQKLNTFPAYSLQPKILRSELSDTNGLLGGLRAMTN
jgi:glucokinase